MATTPVVPTTESRNKELIQIQLEEYRTLRAEVLTRIPTGYQLWYFAGAAFAWLATRPFGIGTAIALVLFVGILGILLWVFRNVNNRIGRHLAGLEKQINERMGVEGLLSWETNQGAGTQGWLR